MSPTLTLLLLIPCTLRYFTQPPNGSASHPKPAQLRLRNRTRDGGLIPPQAITQTNDKHLTGAARNKTEVHNSIVNQILIASKRPEERNYNCMHACHPYSKEAKTYAIAALTKNAPTLRELYEVLRKQTPSPNIPSNHMPCPVHKP